MSGAPLIEYRNVTRRFQGQDRLVTACEGVNLTVREGEFLALVGPSGCGKSTLLNMAAGLLSPSEGQVLYRGVPVSGPNTVMGYLTQRDTLFPWRTIEGNVAVALEIKGESAARRAERTRAIIAKVGLAGFETAYPAQLSGGMRRRAVLARTLVYEPETVAMDEPFGALDSQLRMVMQDELLKIWTSTRSTILFVTHDLGEAIALADRVAVFSARPGRIQVIEEIDLPRPRDVFRVRFEPRFAELYERLWKHLEESVLKERVVA